MEIMPEFTKEDIVYGADFRRPYYSRRRKGITYFIISMFASAKIRFAF